MRTEQEMYDLILAVAREDERIRAVFMNGSRTNPNVPKDIFQDYDIVYVVTETKPFYSDDKWIDRFGERLYMQMPEKMDSLRGMDCNLDECFGYLVQFADGVRMDLHLMSPDFAREEIVKDKLCRVLLDKENILPWIPPATEEDYFVKKPDGTAFLCCCNDFWWCMNNVAKGLWRREVPYVQDMLFLVLRPNLVEMLSWKIGMGNGWSCSIGKSGKYLYRYLSRECWQRFLATYADGEISHIWEAVMVMCNLFHETALEVSEGLKLSYDRQEAENSWNFLKHVRELPEDARAVF